MAIVKMKRIRLIGLERERKDMLRLLQHLGCVELTETEGRLSAPEWAAVLHRDSTAAGELKTRLSRTNGALAALKKYAPTKFSLFQVRPVLTEKEFLDDAALDEALGITDEIQDALTRISQLQSRENHLIQVKAGLIPWDSPGLTLEDASTSRVRITKGVIPAAFHLEDVRGRLYEAAPLSELISVHDDRDQHYVLLLCHREETEAADAALKPCSFSPVQFRDMSGTAADNLARLEKEREELVRDRQAQEARIAGLGDKRPQLRRAVDRLNQELEKELARECLLTDGTIFFLEGWAVGEKQADLVRRLDEFTCAYEFAEPAEGETPPTLLKNPKWMNPINMVTEMYSLPAYEGIDPNPFIFWFFIAFFGFMFADIAYGIILFVVSHIIVKKYNPKNTLGYMFRLGRYLGISTFIFGLITGGFFGDVLTVFGENFLGGRVIQLPYLINPLQNPMQVLIIAIIVGAFQMFFGQCVHIYMEIRDGHPAEGFLDVVPWWLLFAGIGLLVLGKGPILLVVGVVALIATQGRHKKGIFGKLFGGVASLYDITSWLGDFLSYSRLMALMLATSVIASVMNILGSLPGNIIAFVVIFLIGHFFNIGINLIGTYVHAARLQYLEFFGKFYKEGGIPFKPLAYRTKFVDVDTAEREGEGA